MTACRDKELLLGALIDGELDAANAQALEDHLAGCPACARQLRRWRALRAELRAPGLAPRAPDALRRRIEADLAREDRGRRPRLRAAAPWALSGAMAALAASFALVALQPGAGALEDELVADHIRSTLVSHLVDVQTSDRHTVKPWFNGRVDFAPPVPDLADRGFPLVGGRLDYVARRPAAAVVYRRNRHLINLFVWPSRPGPSRPPTHASRQGYAVQHWRAGGLEFWAVSDVEAKDLAAFRDAYVAATAPQSPSPSRLSNMRGKGSPFSSDDPVCPAWLVSSQPGQTGSRVRRRPPRSGAWDEGRPSAACPACSSHRLRRAWSADRRRRRSRPSRSGRSYAGPDPRASRSHCA